jgi:hypothetical protein
MADDLWNAVTYFQPSQWAVVLVPYSTYLTHFNPLADHRGLK